VRYRRPRSNRISTAWPGGTEYEVLRCKPASNALYGMSNVAAKPLSTWTSWTQTYLIFQMLGTPTSQWN